MSVQLKAPVTNASLLANIDGIVDRIISERKNLNEQRQLTNILIEIDNFFAIEEQIEEEQKIKWHHFYHKHLETGFTIWDDCLYPDEWSVTATRKQQFIIENAMNTNYFIDDNKVGISVLTIGKLRELLKITFYE